MPAAEVDVTEELVRRLLVDQHPDLADRSLKLVANGWDNVIFRIGDDLAVRLPRRRLAAELVLNEQRWLPELAPRLPIPIPTPLRSGRPSAEFRWHWTIVPWFGGDVAADETLHAPVVDAERLGAFLAALHVVAPSDAPANPYRGHGVAEIPARCTPRLGQVAGLVDADVVRNRLEQLVDVAETDSPPRWVHGDLHTANVLVERGAISAVIDWGDITAGDPACDLAIGWMLFDEADRAVFRRAAGAVRPVDDATWQRGEAWALHFAVMYLAHSADSPRFERMGRSLMATLGIGTVGEPPTTEARDTT